MQILSSLSTTLCFVNKFHSDLPCFASSLSATKTRRYTNGAEKLFHRVDWERAVGLVVVVDPFDPGSLLYLPASAYIDLIKTALANKSPLVVVHGLNDEIPVVLTTTDGNKVEYQTYTVKNKVVHRVPISSQNSPHPRVSPLTSFPRSKDATQATEFPRKWENKSAQPSSPEVEAKGSSAPSGFAPVGFRSLNDWRDAKQRRRWFLDNPYTRDWVEPEPPRKEIEVTQPHLDVEQLQEKSSLGTPHYSSKLESLRAELGKAISNTIRYSSVRLSGKLGEAPTALRDWTNFLPKKLSPHLSLEWPTLPSLWRRRPFSANGRDEAILLHMYTWAGATLLARSARSLQWSFYVLRNFLVLWQSNGLKTACSSFVEARRVLMKFVSETPVKTSSSSTPIGIDKNGLPTLLPRGLRKYIVGGHVVAIRLAFFMLSVADVLKYEAPPKLETITRPYDGILFEDDIIREEIRLAVEDLIKLAGTAPKKPAWKGFHASIKAGPFAKAMISAPLDSLALWTSSAWTHFEYLARHVKGTESLVSSVRRLAQWTLWFMKPFWGGMLGTLPLGKLSQVIEPRGKIRIVAIPGYPVQTLLRPVHTSLFEFLRALPTDHTHNQEGGVQRVMASGNRTMNSYDLSAATDRFPIWFERVVLEMLYASSMRNSSAFAKAWADLLGELNFSFRKTRKGRYEIVKYGAGQPMGTYSSWASFAVAHHVVVQIAARRAGFEQYVDYDLLGDDIVLRGDTQSHELAFGMYKSLMKDLGVGINPLKGISSVNSTFEFAKRFVKGQEVLSSIKFKELASAVSWRKIFGLLVSLERRGLTLPHLRVALEVGYVLIFKTPYYKSLTDLRKVNLWKLRAFKEILVLLTSPIGPYKVPFVAWLSGRGTYLVDFHPNMGHFVNAIDRVFMGHDVVYPIATGLKSVQRVLATRALEAHTTAVQVLKSLLNTMCLEVDKESGTAALQDSVWKRYGAKEISNAFREFFPGDAGTLANLIRRIGAAFSLKSSNSQHLVEFRYVAPSQRNAEGYSNDLMIGLLRLIVSHGPARIVNRRVLRDLVGLDGITGNPDLDPDHFFEMGMDRGHAWRTSSLEQRIGAITETIIPKDYLHPAQLFDKHRECLTEFMKISVDDMLPSALPAHNDLVEATLEAQTMAITRSLFNLQHTPSFDAKQLFTLPEGTDTAAAPSYILGYTNGVRLDTRNPDEVPRAEIPRAISLRLAAPGAWFPTRFTPHPKYLEKAFSNVSAFYRPESLEQVMKRTRSVNITYAAPW